MKQALLICLFAAMLVWLMTCNRDLVVDLPQDSDGFFSIKHNQHEFSNYLMSWELILVNPGSSTINFNVKDLPDWLNISDTTRTMLPGTNILILTADTTNAIPSEFFAHFTIETSAKTDTVYYIYTYIPPLPSSILTAANQFLISRLGEDIFSNYVTINKHKCRFYPADEHCRQHPDNCADYLQNPYYRFNYCLSAPNMPAGSGLIEFVMDTTGQVTNNEHGYYGLPDCVNNPGECQFPISEAGAIEIAKNAGLEKGIIAWTTKFYWYAGDVQSYVWSVKCTLETADQSQGHEYYASGRTVIIDANSGQIISINEWMVLP